MFIQVGHLNGEVKIYNVALESTGAELTKLIQSELGVECALVQSGSQLNASAILCPDTVYYVTVDAEGGKKKKKKKKAWATKKKIKHRHRKVKLATLKLYTV